MLIHCPRMTKKSSKSVNLRSWSHHDVCREMNLNDLFVIKLIGVWFWIWMIHFTDFLRSYGDGNVEVNSQAFQSLSGLSSCPATPWRPPRPLPCTRIRLTAGIFPPPPPPQGQRHFSSCVVKPRRLFAVHLESAVRTLWILFHVFASLSRHEKTVLSRQGGQTR